MNTSNILLVKANSFGIKPEDSYFQGFKKLVAGTALKTAALIKSSFEYSLNRTPENRKKIFEILDCLNHPFAPTEKKGFFRNSLIPGPTIINLASKKIEEAKAFGSEQLAHLSKNKKQVAIAALLAIGALSFYYFGPSLFTSTQGNILPPSNPGTLKPSAPETTIPFVQQAMETVPTPSPSLPPTIDSNSFSASPTIHAQPIEPEAIPGLPAPDFTAGSQQTHESITQLVDPRAQFEIFKRLALSSQPTIGPARFPDLEVQYGPVACLQSLARYCNQAGQCIFRGIAQCVAPQLGLKQNAVFDFSFNPFIVQGNLQQVERIRF